MNEKENSLRTIFLEAVEITDPAGRAAFLHRTCGDDAPLRQRLEQLLKAHADAGGFASVEGGTILLPVTEKPGDRIGRYKLREQIGEGGCGVVYVAQQEEPVQRRVALKVIKLGMDTRQVVARFEAERQALALMDHPNIARVLDAGATDTGRPYFVMELVRGIKITDYCDQNTLSTKQRLDLFIQVCRAIQHAHQKGIIHRDIKPSNILVTLHDGVPVPKVIDFGIAKATEGRLTDLTVYTELNQFIGTPAYMSPEQAGMSGLDIDTRSDIYSLGVLLYELLTGRTPFDAKALMKAGLDEMRRIVREQEPLKPSTRLSTLAHADLVEVARHRRLEAPKLIHVVRGDLDWIVMKALEKDRARRYETANGLAMDIQRHLQNEPVVACPPTASYRLRKLVERNKLTLAAASAVVVSLLAGFTISTISLFREKAARERAVAAEQAQIGLREQAEAGKKNAQTEAARSGQVAQFMKDMLGGVGPAVARGRDAQLLREILDQTAGRLSKDLAEQPEVEAELRNTLGLVYRDLGEYSNAASMHRTALAIWRKLLGNEHGEVASTLSFLGQVLHRQGEHAEAEAAYREALTIQTNLHGVEHSEVASTLVHLGSLLRRSGNVADAEPLLRRALAVRKKVLGEEHPDVAEALNNLALALRVQPEKLAEAEQMFRAALTMRTNLLGEDHFSVADSLGDLGRTLELRNQLPQAEASYREALALRTKLLGKEHPTVIDSLGRLSSVLTRQAKNAEAEAVQRERLALQVKRLGGAHPEVMTSRGELVELLDRQGKRAEAAVWMREAVAALEEAAGGEAATNATPESLRTLAVAYRNYAVRLRDKRQIREAEAACRRAIDLYEFVLSQPQPRDRPGDMSCYRLSELYIGLSEGLASTGQPAEAEKIYDRMAHFFESCIARFPKVVEYQHELGRRHNHLGLLRTGQGRNQEAEALYRQASVVYEQLARIDLSPDDERKRRQELAMTHQNLAGALQAGGQAADAEQSLRRAISLCEELLAQRPADAMYFGWTVASHARLASLLRTTGRDQQADEESGRTVALWETCLDERRKGLAREHPDVATALHHLGELMRNSGRLTEAEEAFREAAAIRRRLFRNEHREVDDARGNLARVLRDQGKLAEAEAVYREELAVEKKLSGQEHPYVADLLNILAAVLRGQGKLVEAESVIREALAMRRKFLSTDDPDLAATLAELTNILLAQEKFAEAEPLARECLAIRKKKLPEDWPTFNARAMLGRALLGQKKFAEAEPLLLAGYEGMKQREGRIPTIGKPRLKETVQGLVELYELTNRPDQAAEWNKKLAESDKAEPERKPSTPTKEETK